MKSIWILNHHATNQFLEHGGRHYYFAKYLIQSGYSVRIFCTNTVHNSDAVIENNDALYSEDSCDGIPFVFVKARPYKGNGKQRILNMLDFYRNVQKATKRFEKPDVIIGSSVHPLTCVAAIKLAKEYNVPCIAEIRDLWPESIVAYDIAKQNSPVIKLLYQLEKWIYTKANSIIFTMKGGRDYIIEKGWDKAHGGPVNLDKVYHINNGVDLELFDYNREHFIVDDADLDDPNTFKVIYAGSIRKANHVSNITRAAELVAAQGIHDIKWILYGDGDERAELEKSCPDCVTFKGQVKKCYVPFVLSRTDVNIWNFVEMPLLRYGSSPNKLFDYLASGKPIVATGHIAHNVVLQADAGIESDSSTPQDICKKILELYRVGEGRRQEMGRNARMAAEKYDYAVLAKELVKVLEI